VDDVEQAVRECTVPAKEGYGYILGTGDQVARDTPLANFRALVEYGRKYGAYWANTKAMDWRERTVGR
jgi:uroporphyrinogen-III decarboxylase